MTCEARDRVGARAQGRGSTGARERRSAGARGKRGARARGARGARWAREERGHRARGGGAQRGLARNPISTFLVQTSASDEPCIQHRLHRADMRPRGPMDKTSANGARECRFESCRSHLSMAALVPVLYSVPLSRAEGRHACNEKRRGGGIEPLHVSMPRELKSRPSTSPTHPGC